MAANMLFTDHLMSRIRRAFIGEPGLERLRPRLTVIGVGGAGGNAVNNMIDAGVRGIDFAVANTDAQALSLSLTSNRIQLGRHLTQGLGAGSRPEIGRAAAEESVDDVIRLLGNAHMAFITAGMGGGTGTGAAPVIARLARSEGVLTVGVVTKPFHFEGRHRRRTADAGIRELQRAVDTLLVIPNQNLFRVVDDTTEFLNAFRMADDILLRGVTGITDLMVKPGLVNLDLADVRTVMGQMGRGVMGTGEAEGGDRAVAAAKAAISNPLLASTSIESARNVLVNVTGSREVTLKEIDAAISCVRNEVAANARLTFGSAIDDRLGPRLRVSIFAAGIDAGRHSRVRPNAEGGRDDAAAGSTKRNPTRGRRAARRKVA